MVDYACSFHYGSWCRFVLIIFNELKNSIKISLIILANSTIMRSYASSATTLAERTNVMANLSAYQGVGFILGPRN
jgi:hypothetical protein